jgi:ABC-type transport system substrate-binding protein
MYAAGCYSRLLRYETGAGITPATRTVGDAALSVEASDQGQTWTFRLRKA